VVHGFASSLGGLFDIPHGVVCGNLLGPATQITIDRLRKEAAYQYLEKYADIGALLGEKKGESIEESLNLLITKIEEWTKILKIPPLSQYGIKESDLDKIVKKTSNKNNPAQLSKEKIKDILKMRV
jgi:alcohol dehydrogenase class IV